MRKSIHLYFFPFVALLFCLLFSFPSQALAYYTQTGSTVDLPATTTITGNTFLAGNTLQINGTYHGDLFCVGQNVYINANVTGDIICAGQSVQIQGTVDGNIRVAGQNVSVGALAGKNATIFAQSLEIPGMITGDLTLFSQNLNLTGQVSGEMYGAATAATIAGKVGSNVDLRVDTLQVTRAAAIGGNLTYKGPSAGTIEDKGVVRGKIAYTYTAPQQTNNERGNASSVIGSIIYWIFADFVVGLLLILLFRRYLEIFTHKVLHEPVSSLAFGFIPVILTPIVIILLLFTLIGIPLAFILLVLWGVGLFLSQLLVSYAIGRWLLRGRGDGVWMLLLALLIGIVITLIATHIPLIGWLFGFIFVLVGFGAIFTVLLHVVRHPAVQPV